jgi:hypothetical protein
MPIGFIHNLPDECICSASRPALPGVSIFLQCIDSFVCLGILISQRYLLVELDLLGSLRTSSVLEIALLIPKGRCKADC